MSSREKSAALRTSRSFGLPEYLLALIGAVRIRSDEAQPFIGQAELFGSQTMPVRISPTRDMGGHEKGAVLRVDRVERPEASLEIAGHERVVIDLV